MTGSNHTLVSTNLPHTLATLVGRSEALEHIEDRLATDCRLVTVVGPAGIGKTRLVTEYGLRQARRAANEMAYDEIWFCDLSTTRDLAQVCMIVSDVLGVVLGGGPEDYPSQLANAIAKRGPILVILDNLEQVLEATTGTIRLWLDRAPHARFVITSRERLNIQCENVLELGPLAVDPGEHSTPSESESLFIERVRSIRPQYEPDPQERPFVRSIVAKLEGIPLAIELAAARMWSMDAMTIDRRLASQLDLLTCGSSDSAPRHSTLREALLWSWRMLQPPEQSALCQCAVFRGGFSVNAAEAIVDLSRWDDAPPVIDVIHSLREKSVLRDRVNPGARWRRRLDMFESVRSFAFEKLVQSGEVEATFERHQAYHTSTQFAHVIPFGVPPKGEVVDELALERENLKAIIDRCLASSPETSASATVAGRALLVLDPLHRLRGPSDYHVALLEEVITRMRRVGMDATLLGQLLGLWGRLLQDRAMKQAIAPLREALTLVESPVEKSVLLSWLARPLLQTGDVAAALTSAKEAVALLENADAPQELAMAWNAVALVHHFGGDSTATTDAAHQALSASRRAENLWIHGVILNNAGLYSQTHAPDSAAKHWQEALKTSRKIGHPRLEGALLTNLGGQHLHYGRYQQAQDDLALARSVCGAVGSQRVESHAVGALGIVHMMTRRYGSARRLLEEAATLIQPVDDPRHWTTLNLGTALCELFEGFPKNANDRLESTLKWLDGLDCANESRLIRSFLGIVAISVGDLAVAERWLSQLQNEPSEEPHTQLAIAALDLLSPPKREQKKNREKKRGLVEDVGKRYEAIAGSCRPGRSQIGYPWGLPSQVHSDWVTRVAWEVLQHKLTRQQRDLILATALDPQNTALIVADDAEWFRPPSSSRLVRLTRRIVLRAILLALTQSRQLAAGEVLSAHELVQAAWPEERLVGDSGTNRLYTSLSMLRDLGLGTLIVQERGGYLLKPDVPVLSLETGN